MDQSLISRRRLLSVAAGVAGVPVTRRAESVLAELGLGGKPPSPSPALHAETPDGVFNVKAYGAAGDGVKDDSGAIAATIAAVPGQGGIVYFPPGVYAVNSSVVIHGRTDLAFLGAGASATRLLMNRSGVTLLSFTGVCSRITIRDLWLGSTARFPTGGAISVVGTSGIHSDSFLVENVRLQDSPAPWYSQYLDNSQVRNVRIMQTIPGAINSVGMLMNTCLSNTFTEIVLLSTAGQLASEGVRVDYDCDTIIFINSQVLHAGTNGWRCAQTAGHTGPRLCRFTNCYAESCTASGWSIEAARDVRLSACHAAVNGANGFHVSGGDSVTISDSLSLQNGQHGIAVTGGTGVLLSANTCSNNSQVSGGAYHGISIGKNMSGVRIVNNRCGDFVFPLANKQGYGIAVDAVGTDALIITGNDLRDNAHGALDHPSPRAQSVATANIGVAP